LVVVDLNAPVRNPVTDDYTDNCTVFDNRGRYCRHDDLYHAFGSNLQAYKLGDADMYGRKAILRRIEEGAGPGDI
jgi:hypothetical protein